MSHTITLTPAVCQAIGHVGAVVTLHDRQYTVHSVEGRDWYAFNQDDSTIVDLDMTPTEWITEPVATLIPAGHKLGDGNAVQTELAKIERGVCLAKY